MPPKTAEDRRAEAELRRQEAADPANRLDRLTLLRWADDLDFQADEQELLGGIRAAISQSAGEMRKVAARLAVKRLR